MVCPEDRFGLMYAGQYERRTADGMHFEYDRVPADAIRRCERTEYDVIVVDRLLPGDGSLEALGALRATTGNRVPVVVIVWPTRFPVPMDLLRAGRFEGLWQWPDEADAAVGQLQTILRGAVVTRRRELVGRFRAHLAANPAGGGPARADGSGDEARIAPRSMLERLCVGLASARLPVVRELRCAPSPYLAMAMVVERLRAGACLVPAGEALVLRNSASRIGAEEGTPATTPDALYRVEEDHLAAAIHAMPEAERDVWLYALQLAVPGPLNAPALDPAVYEQAERRPFAVRLAWVLHDVILGWFWLFDDGVAIASEPAAARRFDDEQRLHAVDRPAIEYADGSGIHALHGFRVDPRVIHRPDAISAREVRGMHDAAGLRVVRNHLGIHWYLRDLRPEAVDLDTVPVMASDPRGPSITRALVDDADGVRLLVASDGSTGQVYAMRVPRWVSTCAEAAGLLANRPDLKIVAEA